MRTRCGHDGDMATGSRTKVSVSLDWTDREPATIYSTSGLMSYCHTHKKVQGNTDYIKLKMENVNTIK